MSEERGLRIIKATERGECSIAVSDLLNTDGTLRLIEFSQNRGLVELKQSGNTLKLKIGGVVGRLPITERVALDIEPKFPIQNLTRMIDRARLSSARIAPIERVYQEVLTADHQPDAIIRAFAMYLRRLLAIGIQKTYVREEAVGSPRARLNIRKTQQCYWSRGIFDKAVADSFDFTSDLPVNRLLKAATLIALPLSKGLGSAAADTLVFREALGVLARVNHSQFDLQNFDAAGALRGIPTFRDTYQFAVPLALALVRGSTVLHDHSDAGLLMPSFLIEMDTVFEAYIRNVLYAFFSTKSIMVRDGNLEKWQRPLLRDNKRYRVKPDLVVLRGSANPLAIADVKYKPKPAEEDRYQIISHALSYQVPIAVLIYPLSDGRQPGLRRLGKTGFADNAVELFEYHFDLAADLTLSEADIGAKLESLLPHNPSLH